MASHGAQKEVALAEPRAPKEKAKVLREIAFSKVKDGSLLATHHFESHPSEPAATFENAGEAGEHLGKHFGIAMPGRAKGTVAAPASGEAKEED